MKNNNYIKISKYYDDTLIGYYITKNLSKWLKKQLTYGNGIDKDIGKTYNRIIFELKETKKRLIKDD